MPNDHRQKAKQITMSESLWSFLEDLGEQVGYVDERGIHSRLVREMVSAAANKWSKSPYICESAKHVVLITDQGHVFYRQVQILRLNSERKFLPCVMEMKPEKQRDFRRRRPAKIEEADWIRSRWLINYFGAWHGEEIEGSPLSSWADLEGTDSKMADLLVDQGRGRKLTREILVGVRDYVQWKEGQPGYDRIDLPIDIPTRDLEFLVVVDLDLYRNSLSATEVPGLDVEFRNREGARFEGREIALDLENAMEIIPGRSIGKRRSKKEDQVLEKLRHLKARTEHLAQAQTDAGPVLTDSGRQALHESLKLPERFLFLTLDWPSPYWGVEVCIRWEKPTRPAPPTLLEDLADELETG